jgi:hypothetical protein
MARIRLRVRFNGGVIDRTFVFITLANYAAGSTLDYLQFVRGQHYAAQGGENSGTAYLYWRNLCARVKDLVDEVRLHYNLAANPEAGPGAILRVPSGRNLNCPYHGAIKPIFANTTDISANITKGNVSSGDPNSAFNDVFDDINIVDEGDLPDLTGNPSVLIVDDVFSTGKTVVAIIQKLQQYFPAETAYVVACPLRIAFTTAQLAAIATQHDTLPL